jgi:hypothetical protein
MMKLSYVMTVGALACGLIGLPAVAQTQGAGQDLKDAAKDTGRAVKKTGRKVKHKTKKAVNKAAAGTEKGADKVRQKTK